MRPRSRGGTKTGFKRTAEIESIPFTESKNATTTINDFKIKQSQCESSCKTTRGLSLGQINLQETHPRKSPFYLIQNTNYKINQTQGESSCKHCKGFVPGTNKLTRNSSSEKSLLLNPKY